MANFEIIMPKLGESVLEATIVKWFKAVGDTVEEDDPILEIATDKVDAEIPSPVAGTITKLFYEEGSLVPVGEKIALIQLEGTEAEPVANETTTAATEATAPSPTQPVAEPQAEVKSESGRFYSPLVKSIAKTENISMAELEAIQGSGENGRLTKNDVLAYLSNRKQPQITPPPNQQTNTPAEQAVVRSTPAGNHPQVKPREDDEVIPMDRMRRIIAEHMVASKHTAPHVTSVVEADVTNIVAWRTSVKAKFEAREGEKLTYMPVFIEAVAKALKEFPRINASTDGENIFVHKSCNIGIAVSLPSGNLIVPVIKHADRLNIVGITKELNTLATKARNNKLQPDDISGGTFSITNFGSFGNIIGTPIINHPEAAILATGTIEKKPAIITTPTGDTFAVRHKMYLSLSYDHRIIDGALGGAFLKRIADILEGFEPAREI